MHRRPLTKILHYTNLLQGNILHQSLLQTALHFAVNLPQSLCLTTASHTLHKPQRCGHHLAGRWQSAMEGARCNSGGVLKWLWVICINNISKGLNSNIWKNYCIWRQGTIRCQHKLHETLHAQKQIDIKYNTLFIHRVCVIALTADWASGQFQGHSSTNTCLGNSTCFTDPKIVFN